MHALLPRRLVDWCHRKVVPMERAVAVRLVRWHHWPVDMATAVFELAAMVHVHQVAAVQRADS